MSQATPEALTRLMQEFEKLPGIGPRSAERLAFHVLKSEKEEALALARAIADVKQNVRHCRVCYNLTQTDPCPICADPRRDPSAIFVVEQPKDLLLLEDTGLIRGLYHVLLGHIAPLDGVEPGDLTIDALVERVKAGGVNEVVLATNPTMEGEGTALHIRSLLTPLGVKVTQLARGLPAGSQIEYANRAILKDAIEGRRDM
ncbi:MAG: recombination protein RecR [Phycisphaerae bacterium]|nr:recombination mediator RecR [Phycisphaerae bacterium]NUQ47646.1 recombination protein RecR [Phycisphaerae bacterium]